MYKQMIIIRNDLNMFVGKKCVQSCHACLGAYQKSQKTITKKWSEEGQKKVVLEVNSEKEIINLFELAKKEKIACFLVQDAGLTELEPGTITALGIGPDEEEKIDKITRNLKLLK